VTRGLATLLLASAALIASGCAGAESDSPVCDAHVYGACLVLDPDLAPRPTPPAERARVLIEVGALYWGADAATVVAGWTIYAIRADSIPCAGNPGLYRGCTYRDRRVIVLSDTGDGCFEEWLAHEIGHVVLNGDPQHLDPRWELDLRQCVDPVL
jgi:hypothetical protein